MASTMPAARLPDPFAEAGLHHAHRTASCPGPQCAGTREDVRKTGISIASVGSRSGALSAAQSACQFFCMLASTPQMRHTFGMTATVKLDASNRVVLSRDLRRAAGIPRGQRLKVSATPGRLVLEVEPNPGRVVKRGKLRLWSGQVPSTPIEEAVDVVRHYER